MRKIIPLLIAICSFYDAFAQYLYPPTKTVDSSDTYFGVTYKDPYRLLEYMKESQTETWFKEQATYTDSVLNKLNGRDELIAEWKQVDKQFPIFYSDLTYENGRLFYRKTMTGESFAKLYYRDGMNGKEELLFDPTTYIPGKTLSLESFRPSHDGKKIGFVYSEKGAEIGTLKVMIVDTKQFLMDSISPLIGISSWTFDNSAFLYTSIKSGDSKDPTSRLNSKVKLHILGNEVSGDADFFSSTSYPGLNIDPKMFPFVFLDEDSKDYIIAGLGSTQREFTRYYAPAGQLNSKNISWKSLCKPSDKLVNLEYINDDIYAISHNNAPNYKVIATSMAHPDWANAVTIAPEKPDWIIKDFIHTKDYLLIVYSDGINCHLSKYNFKTKITSEVKLPYLGSIGIYCVNTRTNNFRLYINSRIKPYTEYNCDAETDLFSPSNFNRPFVYPAAYSDLQVEELEVKGHDGAMIPLTIIYKKGIRKNGSNICLLEGYGAYGSSLNSHFDYFKNSLAARDVVIAIAHVRGGGEKGEAWHMAGFKTTKPNTWKDFISCAEYLIAKGYTSSQKLAGIGISAGGILISRALTERPDLFAAAICDVGAANAMRSEFTANGPANIPEFGTIKDSTECKALYEMDGMQHVIKGTKYPAVICVGGWNDARVPAWEPGKFAAALQNASTSGKPVLMKVNYDSGHFTEDRNLTLTNFAGQYTFLLWQCGDPDFQPRK
jgi:prolyl oligopeptidase